MGANHLDLWLSLGSWGLVFLIMILWFIRSMKRKRKDVYGFQLKNWQLLEDDSHLYEIEQLFKRGFVASYFNQEGYSISDWHSNLRHTQHPHFTGFIAMAKTISVRTWDTDSNDSFPVNFGWATLSGSANRYFLTKLKQNLKEFVVLNSMEKKGLSSSLLTKLDPLIEKLESTFGFKKWNLIGYRGTLILLAPEIFDPHRLNTFLDVSQEIAKIVDP